MSLDNEHTMQEVADALRMSHRWVRAQVQAGAAHQRYGNRIRFTDEQVESLRRRFASVPDVAETVLTTRRRRSA